MGIFGPPNIEKLKSNGNIERLIKALGYKDENIREAAINALAGMGEVAISPLIQALNDSQIQSSVSKTLGKIGENCSDKLIKKLYEEVGDGISNSRVETTFSYFIPYHQSNLYKYFDVFKNIGLPAFNHLTFALNKETQKTAVAVTELIENIKDPFSMTMLPVRAFTFLNLYKRRYESTIGAVGMIGEIVSTDWLLKTLRNGAKDIRHIVENSVENNKNMFLENASELSLLDLNAFDECIRLAAVEALKVSTKKDMDNDVVQWEKWWNEQIQETLAKVESIEDLVNPLLTHIKDAYNWGELHDFPLVENYPQFNYIQMLGAKAHQLDGLSGMQRLRQKVNHLDGWSDHWWNNIGGWQA